MGDHGCVIPGRGCQAVRALEQLFQQQPIAAIILGALFLVVVCALILWLLDIRGSTNWKPHTEYEPPRPKDRE